jgi:hypothetical protein
MVLEMQPLINIPYLKIIPFQACLHRIECNKIFKKLSFSQRGSSRIIERFKLVFKAKLLNKHKSF